MRGRAFAKVNLGLRVKPARPDGFHPLVSLAQSIGWADDLALELGDEDRFEYFGPGGAPEDETNLGWRALEAMRGRSGPALHLTLDKSIPVAAGLGGGSADAALALVLATGVLQLDPDDAVQAAGGLGADVPFCLSGGTAWMEGIGDRLTPLAPFGDFWLAVVVPPFEVSTPAVYRRWDELGGPSGPGTGDRDLPISLREHGPLGNDLQPAAVDLVPELGDWISDLSRRWGQPVLMSGSGPTLFGLFPTESEAADALQTVSGARASRAARPVPVGWELEPGTGLPPAPWR